MKQLTFDTNRETTDIQKGFLAGPFNYRYPIKSKYNN